MVYIIRNQWVTPNMCCNYGEDEVYEEDVICIIISKSEGDTTDRQKSKIDKIIAEKGR